MYIRRLRSGQSNRYILRESYRDNGCWRHRNIFDLGEDPGAFIEYPGGNGYYFREEIEDVLRKEGIEYRAEELDAVFWPFLDEHIRRMMGRAPRWNDGVRKWRGISSGEMSSLQSELHSFDKRRLHYLRCGRVDIGELEGRPWKFLNVLLGKSRDEIEHTIEEMEGILRPHEVRTYIYTALNIQEDFGGRLLRNNPAALDGEEVDSRFLNRLCNLNVDAGYFRGVDGWDGEGLHPYLIKYLILYFDNTFRPGLEDDFMNAFHEGRRFNPPPARLPSMGIEEACRLLGIPPEAFDGLDRRGLMKAFRQSAKSAHPDKGGDHETFVKITEAYERLRLRK